ncbi:MAG: ATP-binding cassette domain-containing protein [Bacteroidales bacterium]|nr:ATP-binding cassette domain-containing protein [Bacteroidales bacterium]
MDKIKQHFIDKEEQVISISGLYKSFGDLKVLNGIDFTLYKGENVAILGKSGTGKSVLIKIIVGLLRPDRGEVFALGKPVHSLNHKDLDALRLRIGFSFQSSALYDGMNVYQNLAFPLTMNAKHLTKKEVDTAVEKVLDAVNLRNKKKQMPSELSGGQRKRIGIARTLILKPEIMLYDEPTAGLDPITSTEIIQLINEVQQRYNTSSIIITHDLTCARNTSDRTAMLLDGRFAKVGQFDEIFNTEDQHLKEFYNYNFIQ